MSKTLSSPISFAAAAILFTVASFANASGEVSTSLILGGGKMVAPIEMKSGGSLPPDPWEDPPAILSRS